jgi:hypothetical protein
MSIVNYKCDTCKREIQKIRNPHGLETVGRCVITYGCRGKLYQTNLLEDAIRPKIPDPVIGLIDWFPRQLIYNHNQSIESNQWRITHNLGAAVTVTVTINVQLNGNQSEIKIDPENIIYESKNVILLEFNRPFSGKAQLVARQSNPDPVGATASSQNSVLQISNNGEITVATQVNTIGTSSSVSFEITFILNNGSLPSFVYTADDSPSINSPWINFNRVIISGKIYTVRSFNVINSDITRGIIPTGSPFIVTGIDPLGERNIVPLNTGESYILLAKEPYQIADKIRNNALDMTAVTRSNSQLGQFYDSGECFAYENVIQSVFPQITSA